jgi:IclR family acetate operon transcriptional repressor
VSLFQNGSLSGRRGAVKSLFTSGKQPLGLLTDARPSTYRQQVISRSDSEKPRTTLQTATRALAFLEYVAQSPEPPQLKEVAAALEINITTCYHLFNTLHQAGYLVRVSDGSLRIGGRAAVLYNGLVRNFALGRDLHPVVEELSAETNETAYVTSLSGDGVVIQAVVEGKQAVRVTGLYVGFSGSEHMRASGKAVLAHLPDAARSEILDNALRALNAKERKEILANLHGELAEVRSRGWAFDDRYFADTVCCVSAPFFSSAGDVAGSLAVSMPAERFATGKAGVIDAVCRAASQASQALGHHGLGAVASA